MASLEVRKNYYRLVFWYHGKKFARGLKTNQMADAHLAKARLEDTLRRVELGTITVPEDADLPTFLLSEGRVHQTPGVVEKDFTLTDLIRHVTSHSAYHRGQVVLLLRQLGHAPPSTDYAVFVLESRSPAA